MLQVLHADVEESVEWDLRTLDERVDEAPLPAPAELMVRLGPYCRRLIRKYGSTPEMRQDLMGEIYCILHDLMQAYDTSRGVPLSAYLFTRLPCCVFTRARTEWNRQRREALTSPLDEDWWERQEILHDRFPDRLALRESLLQAMEQLTERQRTVVYMRYFQDREFEDIANVLGIKPVTVRSLLRNGLTRLRETMRAERRPRYCASQCEVLDWEMVAWDADRAASTTGVESP